MLMAIGAAGRTLWPFNDPILLRERTGYKEHFMLKGRRNGRQGRGRGLGIGQRRDGDRLRGVVLGDLGLSIFFILFRGFMSTHCGPFSGWWGGAWIDKETWHCDVKRMSGPRAKALTLRSLINIGLIHRLHGGQVGRMRIRGPRGCVFNVMGL